MYIILYNNVLALYNVLMMTYNYRGYTPLHMAVVQGNYEAVRYILKTKVSE